MSPKHNANSLSILWLTMVAISLMWGSTFLFVKLLVVDVSPFALTAIRGGVATLALAIGLIIARQSFQLSRLHLIHMIFLGTLNGWIPDTLTALAISKIDSDQAGIINAANPIIVALLAHFIMPDERLNWHKLVGIIMGFFGIFLLISPHHLLDNGSFIGSLLMLAATVSYALGTLYGRWVRAFSAIQLSLGQSLFTFLPALCISAAIEPRWNLPLTPNVVFPILILGVFCAAIPNVLFLYLLKQFPATNVSMITYLMPIWAIILGTLILHESIAPHSIIGCAVILLGVWMVNEAKIAV